MRRWLRMLDLIGDYTHRFQWNGYRSFGDLLGLTEDGLEQLEVRYSYDRDRLLHAVKRSIEGGSYPRSAGECLDSDQVW